MEMNKENIKYFLEKLALVLNGIFPGIIILELYFDIGLFSTNLDSFFTILLYLIYGVVISIPFHFLIPRSVENYSTKAIKVFAKIEEVDYQRLKKLTENAKPELKEKLDNVGNQIKFGFIVIQTIIFYLIFKGFKYYNLDTFAFWNIPEKFINLFIVMLITYLISFPSAYIYSLYNITRFERHMKKTKDD